MSDATPGPPPAGLGRELHTEAERGADPRQGSEQAFLTRLLGSLPYPVSYIDADLVYRQCNAAAAATVGRTPEQIIGKTVASVVGADSEVIALLRQVLESGESYSGTLDFTPPGSARTSRYRVSYVPDTDGDGRAVGVLTDVVDVTELSESERRFRTLFESMIEGVALHELVYEGEQAVDYRILEVNAAFEAQTGLSAGAVQGRLASELYGTGEAPYLDEYASVVESGHSISFETYFAPLDRRFRIGVMGPAPGHFATIFEDVTERRVAEEALRESEERYRLLHDTMLQGVVYQDADGTIVSMNPAAKRILGKEPEDFLGSTSVGEEHYTLREDGTVFPGVEHPAMVALRSGQPVPDVLMQVYNPCEARYRLISIQAVPLFRPGEERPYQVYTVFDDVTERKHAEEALREGEARYRSLFSTMQEAFFVGEVITDEAGAARDYRIVEANQAMEAQTGVPLEHYIGNTALGMYPDLDPFWVKTYGRVALTGEPIRFDHYVPQQGRHYDVMAYQAGPRHFAALFLDVTEQKRAEEALRSQAEMLDLSHDAIIVWQPGGTIESWNRGAEELYGFSKAEALGHVSHDLLSTMRQRPWPQIEATLREQGHWEGEVRHHAKDGREIIVSTRHQLVRGGDGVERVLETNRDVTEHRLAETERELLLEAAGALNKPVALADVLDTLARITLEVGGHRRVVISLWQEEPGCLTVARSRGEAALADGMAVAIEDLSAPARRAIENDEALLIDYDAMEPDRRGMGDRYASHLALDVPLFFGGRFVGLLATDDPGERREFSDRQIRLINGIAAHAAVAIESARAYEAETAAQREQAAQEERSRLARDLHDSVTQALFAATLKAEALTLADESLQSRTSSVAEEVRRLNRGALAEMRTLLLELRGDPLESVPIAQLLRQLVEAAEGRAGVDVQLTVRGDAQAPPVLHGAIYRIVQEALNNITRHARAAKAWVDLGLEPDVVHLLVGDDGCGFEPGVSDPTHMGLRSMRERAEDAGARFDIVTELGGGTEITVDWQRD